MRVQRYAWAAFAVVFLASWWRAPWPAEQALHDSLAVLAVAALIWARRRYQLPTSSVVLVLCFLSLHVFAARWLYSYVPYDQWTRALFGRSLSEVFGWHRNHFDRLVHLSYGLCVAAVIFQQLRERLGVRPWVAAVVAVDVVLSTSALYELLEWGIAMTLAPDVAEAYNGQQGDVWDAHKDMTLAVLGAVVAAVWCALPATRRPPPVPIRHTVRKVHQGR